MDILLKLLSAESLAPYAKGQYIPTEDTRYLYLPCEDDHPCIVMVMKSDMESYATPETDNPPAVGSAIYFMDVYAANGLKPFGDICYTTASLKTSWSRSENVKCTLEDGILTIDSAANTRLFLAGATYNYYIIRKGAIL